MLHAVAFSQEKSLPDRLINLPNRFFSSLDNKILKLDDRLSKQTEKYLQRLVKQEARLKRRLSRVDSSAAKQLFNQAPAEYEKLIGKMKLPQSDAAGLSGEYLPYVDSLRGCLSFLDNNKAKQTLAGLTQLQSKLQHADKVKEFIRQRKQQIREALSRYTKLPAGLKNQLQDFNKEVYYYQQQVREYREMLNDPDKMTQKALSLLNKLPAFRDFMKQHSQLASLFGLPAGYGNVTNLGGLQTRAQVQSMIQGQVSSAGANGMQVLQQNVQAAQAQLSSFKEKLRQLGNGSGDIDLPDFKPNDQRTKTFLQRLEVGTNLQSTRSNRFFPTTTDLGLSVGYKINDNNTVGIGGSYKVGWGKDIRNIVVSSQGAALRSFVDIRIKKSFYASGGFEYNYQVADSIVAGNQFRWSKSGLIGVSKIVSLKTKFFKKTRVQLLWDFMSYQQAPRTQPLIFRCGYNF